MKPLGIQTRYQGTFDQALVAVTEALKVEGFGVLTEIDVKATLAKKLGVDFRAYRILGACSPPFAYEALKHEPDLGLLLPCNVIVYEADDGAIAVRAIDPMQTLAAQGDGPIAEVAAQVKAKLERVIAAVGGAPARTA